ncbi:hypothetical protein ACG0Z6_11695 [Roseateles sp. BYS180W]|uniref:GspL cytoplasmic actin-ATPase-like domain-containing protein n=1 Tax=Roseateles rivi TaxID=3299028 RepID=A0ABW7FX57_9BURK
MSRSPSKARRWLPWLKARLARPRRLWLGPEGVWPLDQDASHAQSLAQWLAQQGPARVELVLAEQLQHPLLCAPELPLPDLSAVQHYARTQFTQYHGSAAQHWALAPWRSAQGPCGASALSGLDWAATRAQALQHQQWLSQARPAWAVLLQHLASTDAPWLHAEHAALAWVEGPLLCWLRLEHGQCRQLSHRRLHAPSAEALDALLQTLHPPGLPLRLAGFGLSDGAPRPRAGLQVLGPLNASHPNPALLQSPPRRAPELPQPDYAAALRPSQRLGWALALGGLTLLLASAWSSAQRHAELQASSTALALAQARTPQARAHAAQLTPPTPAQAQAQQLLSLPWPTLLAQVERAGLSAGPQALRWLSLDFQSAQSTLRLEGWAQERSAALGLVEALRPQAGWQDVVLGSLRQGEGGSSGLRFDVQARLDTRVLAATAAASAASGVAP